MAESYHLLQCPSCMQTYKDPRILKACGHSICLSCAEFQFFSQLSSLSSTSDTGNLSKKDENPNPKSKYTQGIPITCCKCNEKTFLQFFSPPKSELAKNVGLNELLQLSKDKCSNGECSKEATHGCVGCKKMLCEEHKESHDDVHECLDLKDYKEKMGKGSEIVMCKFHQIPCNYFFEEGNIMICIVCKEEKSCTIGSKIKLKGKLSKITGKNKAGFDNSSMKNAMFNNIYLKYKQSSNKIYISDQNNFIIRSIKNISINDNKWKWSHIISNISNISMNHNGELKIEVGQPKQEGYCNGDQNTCKLREPNGFDWDMNDNMYICNSTCICKVDGKSNQVSLVAGHATDKGYKDGNHNEARFCGLSGILCFQQQNHHQSPLLLYVCDSWNHCIRMIDVTDGKTTTFAGNGKYMGDADGTLQSTVFNLPWDIVKDDENDHILYVSDSYNHKIKMIDMKKGVAKTFVGNGSYESILNFPQQMQIIDSFIYVACFGFNDCVVRIGKHSRLVTKIKFNDGKKVPSGMYGITYHQLDQCFYISDRYNIYKLE